MNILLSLLQILLAVHTAIGAVWKFSHTPEQTMPSLAAIPNAVWLGMSVLELLCAVALILPLFDKRLAKWVPVAAIYVAAEMLLFTGLHLVSGDGGFGPVVYWLVVAALSAFIAYGRSAREPALGIPEEKQA